MRRKNILIVGLACVASCLNCLAQWSTTVTLKEAPGVCNLFEEVARMERGIVRFVTLDALQAQLNNEPCSYDDVALDFRPEEEYFNIHIGAPDNGSGDSLWQSMQGKLLWTNEADPAEQRCILANYLIDHSPQEEYRYLYFYEYNPQTGTLSSVPKPFDTGFDDSELFYDIKSNGSIDVKRWGEHLTTLVWDGEKYQSR